MKLWTVEFQVPEIVEVPAESEEEAIELACERVIELGYLSADVREEIDYPRYTSWIDTDKIFDHAVEEFDKARRDEKPDEDYTIVIETHKPLTNEGEDILSPDS